MATQITDGKFDIGSENCEPRTIIDTYRLQDSKLIELLSKLDSHEHFRIYLRGKGIEVWGEFKDEVKKAETSRSIGMITSGYNLNKPDTQAYLITFDYKDKEDRLLVPITKLADIVKDYLVI